MKALDFWVYLINLEISNRESSGWLLKLIKKKFSPQLKSKIDEALEFVQAKYGKLTDEKALKKITAFFEAPPEQGFQPFIPKSLPRYEHLWYLNSPRWTLRDDPYIVETLQGIYEKCLAEEPEFSKENVAKVAKYFQEY